MTATTAPIGESRRRGRGLGACRSILLVIGVTGLVGFLAVGQLRGSEAFRQRLQSENEGDLTRILAGLTTEADALRDEISTLKLQLLQLQSSQAADSAAAAAAEAQLRSLRVLAGTVAVSGPGLTMKIDDPEGALLYDTLIDVVAELRDAGAEALAVNGRRVGAGSAFGERDGTITLDGISLSARRTRSRRSVRRPRSRAASRFPAARSTCCRRCAASPSICNASRSSKCPRSPTHPNSASEKWSRNSERIDSRAMNVPEDLKYTSDHEWVRSEGDRVRVGITDFAQDALGDVVFVGLPERRRRGRRWWRSAARWSRPSRCQRSTRRSPGDRGRGQRSGRRQPRAGQRGPVRRRAGCSSSNPPRRRPASDLLDAAAYLAEIST